MANYPEVQAKAQTELDAVVSQDRLPEFNDSANLPYITAIVSELFRWQPVAPLGIPRRCFILLTSITDSFLGFRSASFYDGRRRIQWVFYPKEHHCDSKCLVCFLR